MIAHWARECSDKRIVAVCHGHVMRALQIEFEDLGHDDFIRLDSSEEHPDKIRNCQILWYTRRDHESNNLLPHLAAVRSICPWDPTGDYGWHTIKRRRSSNEELAKEVENYTRHIK